MSLEEEAWEFVSLSKVFDDMCFKSSRSSTLVFNEEDLALLQEHLPRGF